jgi:hypothetical protein
MEIKPNPDSEKVKDFISIKQKNPLEQWSKQDLERLKDKEPCRYLDQYLLGKFEPLKDGEECEHKGCRNHISHPCDNCGRIGASYKLTKEYYEKN